MLYNFYMKKICLLFGVIFLFVNFVFAEDFMVIPPSVSLTVRPENNRDLKTYVEQLKEYVDTAWKKKNVKSDLRERALVEFKINKAGLFSEPKIVFSSGSTLVDDEVLNTIKELKHFKPLPETFKKESIVAHFYFIASHKTASKEVADAENDFVPYIRDLQRRIKMNWNPPKGRESLRVVLLFRLEKNGTLLSSAVFKSSGDKEADKAALDALQNSAPFKPLPESFKGKSIDIQFTFDYNVFYTYSMKSVPPAQPKPVDEIYYENLDKNLLIVKKNLIREHDGYKYIHALKLNDFSYTAYLLQSRIDCRNRQIGVKKVYAGAYNMSHNVLGFTRLVNVFADDVKMKSPDNNTDYMKIYNYVCQP